MSNPFEKSTIKEYSLGIDKFNRPAVYDEPKSTYIKIVRLILLEKGTYPTRPNMGVGLISNYRYFDDIKVGARKLKQDIMDQINTYLPEYKAVVIDTEFDKKNITIDITINKITFQLTYNKEENTLSDL